MEPKVLEHTARTDEVRYAARAPPWGPRPSHPWSQRPLQEDQSRSAENLPWTVVGGTLLNGTFTPFALSYGLGGEAARFTSASAFSHILARFTALFLKKTYKNYTSFIKYRTLDTISIGRLWQAYVRAAARTWAGPTQAARSR